MSPDDDTRKPAAGADPPLFALLNEIGIIDQLAQNRLERLLPDGIKVSQFVVLNHLVRLGDNRTPVQLARAFQVTKGAITNTLHRLEARRLISVVADAEDGRSKRVCLTDEGRRMREACVAATAPILALLDGEATPAEVADTLAVLRRIRARLDRARDPIP
jgi:DNA-binding MarR family transcriptional regulator